jgi:hypothetical protein
LEGGAPAPPFSRFAPGARLCFEHPLMPSEKAKENKQLTAACAGCGAQVSTELLTGRVIGRGRDRRIVPVCDKCAAKGWTPPADT